MQNTLWIIGAFVLALAAGPVALIHAKTGTADAMDIYFVFEPRRNNALTSDLAQLGVNEVGPATVPFGRLVIAPPYKHKSMKQAGHLMLPASALAGICGVQSVAAQSSLEDLTQW